MGSRKKKSESSSRKRSFSSSSSESRYRLESKRDNASRCSVRSSSSSSNWSSSPSPENLTHQKYLKRHKSRHKKHEHKSRSLLSSPSHSKRKKHKKSSHRKKYRSSSQEREHSEKHKERRKSATEISTKAGSRSSCGIPETSERKEICNKATESNSRSFDITSTNANEIDTIKSTHSVHNTKKIEIKILKSIGKDAQSHSPTEKTDLFGKWEPVEKQKLKDFTDLCKKLSKEGAEEEFSTGKNVTEKMADKKQEALHHPFQVQPASPLPKLSTAALIPTNPAQAIQAGMIQQVVGNFGLNARLPKEIQAAFPVSSGVQHRTKENASDVLPNAPVFESPQKAVNINAIIADRLKAQKAISANPFDIEAIAKLKGCDEMIKQWSRSNVKPEQFTGEKTKNILSKDELEGGYSVWARKDFFNNLQPIRDGVGLRLLLKMGWSFGQPLGKNRSGYINPLCFEVRTDRRGLSTAEDNIQTLKAKRKGPPVIDVQGKHPVSALAEICTKRRWPMPDYKVVMDSGPSHRKSYLFKVTVNGQAFTAVSPSPNKKNAKAQAATTALDQLGLLS